MRGDRVVLLSQTKQLVSQTKQLLPLAKKICPLTAKQALLLLGVIVFALAWYGYTPPPAAPEEPFPERIYS